jgi:aminopeptidase YwaD
MKQATYVIVLLMALNIQLFGQNPLIQNAVNLVSGDSIFSNIALLEQMERFTFDDDPECPNYIISYLQNHEFDTIYSQDYTSNWLPNIIAIKYGTVFPDSVYVLGAHYDSFMTGAPGADDNASGASGVLEVARILSDYELKKTIIFVLFSGEELGLHGSEAFVDTAINNKMEISGMINLDMISYVNPGNPLSVNIIVNNFSIYLMNLYISSLTTYVPELPCIVDSTTVILNASDHSSFWSENIPALFLIEESDFFGVNQNYNIHSSNDILGLSANNQILAELITKSVVATLMDLAETDSSTTLLAEAIYNKTILAFPNPTKGLINITMNNAQTDITSIEIYNFYGQKLNSVNSWKMENPVDISIYPNGIYFIKLSGDNFNDIVKIIKE